MTRILLAIAVIVPVLTGCETMPELAAKETVSTRTGDYPELAPLPELLARTDVPARTTNTERELAARSANLKARAARLRQPAD